VANKKDELAKPLSSHRQWASNLDYSGLVWVLAVAASIDIDASQFNYVRANIVPIYADPFPGRISGEYRADGAGTAARRSQRGRIAGTRFTNRDLS
jgi:hypothetical protein